MRAHVGVRTYLNPQPDRTANGPIRKHWVIRIVEKPVVHIHSIVQFDSFVSLDSEMNRRERFPALPHARGLVLGLFHRMEIRAREQGYRRVRLEDMITVYFQAEPTSEVHTGMYSRRPWGFITASKTIENFNCGGFCDAVATDSHTYNVTICISAFSCIRGSYILTLSLGRSGLLSSSPSHSSLWANPL